MTKVWRILVGFSLLFFVSISHGDNDGDKERVDRYHKKYIETMEKGLKCHPGFTKLSPKVKTAAQTCSKMTDISSYLCYLTCVYRGFEYVVRNTTSDLDFGMADLVTMDSFKMNTFQGRNSYQKISTARHICGQDYVVKKFAKFAFTYEDPEKCREVEEFFKCSFKSLTCNSPVAAEMERR